MLRFEKGLFSFADSSLENGVLNFVFEDASFSSAELSWTGTGEGGWTAALPNKLQVSLSFSGDAFSASFRNDGERLFLKEMTLEFPPSLLAEDYLEYTHSRLFLEQASGVKPVGLATSIFEHNPSSYMLYLLAPRKGGKTLLFAALPPCKGDFIVFKALHETPSLRGRFGVRVTAEECRSIAPGAAFELSTLLFKASEKNPTLLLEELGDLYAERRHLKLKSSQSGWNSWDELHTSVKPEDVYRVQKELKAFSGGKIQTFVVDDGWQIAYGAWTPNPKFPQDLATFCKKVAEEGGIPGIWTAPLCLANDYMVPREWIASTPVPDRRHVLDITHPGAQEHIRTVYATLRKAGFRYFKVDFTNCILEAKKLHDMSYGKAGVLRKTYEIIREAIGPDSYFLGCCVPFEPAFDIVDAVRTTADIQIHWSCVEINMTSASARWWMHRKLWNNDSDFMVVRGPETSTQKFQGCSPFTSGKYCSGPVLSERDAKTLALALYMTNGDLMFSDNFSKLNERGRGILSAVLSLTPLKRAARPVDLFTCGCGRMPSLWFDEDSGKLAVFNWGEDFQRVSIVPSDFGKTHLSGSFWNGEALAGESITLAPHESIGLTLS